MGLEEYLNKLEASSQGDLTNELGIVNNWPILLKIEHDLLIRYFEDSDKYRKRDEDLLGKGTQYEVDGSPAVVDIYDGASLYCTTGFGFNLSDEYREHSQRQMEDYNISLIIFGSPNNMIFIADVVRDIGNFILNENLPACFPHSVGSNYQDPFEFDRILYHKLA